MLSIRSVHLRDLLCLYGKPVCVEEEQVFIATTKGRYGPKRPLHPKTCSMVLNAKKRGKNNLVSQLRCESVRILDRSFL